MSIVSSELVSSEQNGTRFDVHYHYVDHLGNDLYVRAKLPIGTDINQDILDRIPGLEQDQADIEVDGAVGRAKADIDPNIVAEYQAQNDYDRRALGRFMTIASTDHFYIGLTLFKGMETRGGANANQRASYLGIDLTIYGQIADRFGDVEGIAFFLTDAKNAIWPDLPEEME